MQPGVFENWIAAAPVVAFGAPLGAFMVDLIGRKPTLMFVAILCVGQLVWTLHEEKSSLGLSGIMVSLIAVGACLFGFERLRLYGAFLVGEIRARRKAETQQG